MPSPKSLGETPRKVLHVFYILDTSGSMEGSRISEVNQAMRETAKVLSQQAERNADARIKIAVLEFNSNCRWMQPLGPEDMEDFVWKDLSAGGMTNMGEALKELNSKLSRDRFLKSDTGLCMPVFIFMTDGFATDKYEKALKEIRKNALFANGTKIGFAIGDNADTTMIADIVGTGEAVIYTDDLKKFASQLKFVTATASKMGSLSQTTESLVSGSTVVRRALEENVISQEDILKDTKETWHEPKPEDVEDFGDDFDDFFDGDFKGE